MKTTLKRLVGADLPKVIAVTGRTRQQVEASVAHARTSGTGLPIWGFCEEPSEHLPGCDGSGCDHFESGVGYWQLRKRLTSVWPALTVVNWDGDGKGSNLFKLAPLTVLPFRVVVCNEDSGYFAATPASVAGHGFRRFRNAFISAMRRLGDWTMAVGPLLYSFAYNTGQRVWDVFALAGNMILALMGWMAQLTPGITRAAMRGITGGRPSPFAKHLEHGSGVLEIVVPNRGWPRRKIAKAVRNSVAEFIVLRRRDPVHRLDPLLALARETGAFTVAWQSAYTSWRKQVVNRHPFRQLQPNEVAQVFGPWSPVLVIRRDILQKFGVPHAVTYGAALNILYWKAAAAGLQNLILGHGDSITQEPAMELEDAEFVARLAVFSSIRKLAPAHPYRQRGNVAWSQANTKPFRDGKPRVLVVSPYLPFPLSHGGAVRIYNLCREMSGDVDFILACFREANETVRYPELHEVFRQVYTVDIDEKYPYSTLPDQVTEYRNSAMADLVQRLCVDQQVDLLQLEYTQMAEYRKYAGPVPVLLVEHDITFTLYKQLSETPGNPRAAYQFKLWDSFERESLGAVDAVWTMSDQDRDLALDSGSPWKQTTVVPNGVDLARFQPVRRQYRERAVLFVGSFRHLPNLLAFESLLNEIMPAVWAQFPDTKLHVIAGPHHEKAVKAAKKEAVLAADPRIDIQGFVEDVRPAYRECDVVVIPLPVSAGTNIKLMEAMACGRAVVSTGVGCQGLGLRDGEDLLVREIGPGFAEAVSSLLGDEALRTRIAAAARVTAEMRLGWDSIANDALDAYSRLTGKNFSRVEEPNPAVVSIRRRLSGS